MKRDFLSIWDLEKDEIYDIFHLSDNIKKFLRKDESYKPLKGKVVALLFEKPSTRTRVSFEAAVHQLGGYPIFLSSKEIQLARGESLEDTARVLSRYVQAVIIRTYEHDKLVKFAATSDAPVINALSDLLHPCQAMADYYTLWQKKRLDNIKFAYVGDGNNVCNSLILGAAKLGIKMVVATPEDYQPDPSILKKVEDKKANITITTSPLEAVKGADVVYTDTWVSMGKEDEKKLREKIFKPYQVNRSLLSLAKPDVLVMHCLPAHRGEEITDEVMDGKNSIVFEQAENRLHVQRAILVKLMK